MGQALRTLAVLTVVMVASGTAGADSGRSAERAGQKMQPNRKDQEQARFDRAQRIKWLLLMEKARRLSVSNIQLPGGTVRGLDSASTDSEARDADPPR